MNSYPTFSQKLLLCLGGAALFLASFSVAKAQDDTIQPVLLEVQVSTAGEVTITATGNMPSTGLSSGSVADGIDLIDFFSQNTSGVNIDGGDVTSNLTSFNNVGSGNVYQQGYTDSLITEQNTDLNLYTSGSHASETFSTSSVALTGTFSFSLSANGLPAVNSSGAIYTGYQGSSPGTQNVEIGTWEVVAAPEPSSWMLLLGGIAGFAIFRVRRAAWMQALLRR